VIVGWWTRQSGWYLGRTDELLKGFAVRRGWTAYLMRCGEGGWATLFCANRGSPRGVRRCCRREDRVFYARRVKLATPARKAEGYVSIGQPLPLEDGSYDPDWPWSCSNHVEKASLSSCVS